MPGLGLVAHHVFISTLEKQRPLDLVEFKASPVYTIGPSL